VAQLREPKVCEVGMLSEREEEVLVFLAQGAAKKEIALRVHISERTAKAHVSNIFYKLGVNSPAEAVAVAMRTGLQVRESWAPSISACAIGSSTIQVGQRRCSEVSHSSLGTVQELAMLVTRRSAQACRLTGISIRGAFKVPRWRTCRQAGLLGQ
jgi:DNA-binding CsgD family transcriptional regulator